jgi:hypothetical protein
MQRREHDNRLTGAFPTLRARSSRLRPLAAGLAAILAVAPGAGNTLGLAAAAVDIRAAGSHAARSAGSSSAVTTVVPVLNCDDGSPGSLRQIYANAVDNEDIDLSHLACSRITLTLGALVDPPSATNVSLRGPGRDRLTIDGGGLDRVLVHRGIGGLHVDGLSITGGHYAGTHGGGCIYSNGGLEATGSRISSCTLEASTTTAAGGAIYAKGAVNMFGSIVADSTANAAANGIAFGGGIYSRGILISGTTISGNTATNGKGGGLFVGGTSLLDIENSTISGNHADFGGGLFTDSGLSGSYLILNSTIAGNSAKSLGGGVYSRFPTNVFNSTIVQNTVTLGDAGSGAGLCITHNEESEMESSIVARNTAGGGLIESDVSLMNGAYLSGRYNLVIVGTTDPASTLGIADTVTADPMLGPLRDNGGETQTLALSPDSPAIDRGSNIEGLVHDQRGAPFPRVDGARADIGAFEFVDQILANGFEPSG